MKTQLHTLSAIFIACLFAALLIPTAKVTAQAANSKWYHYTPDGKTYFEFSHSKILIKFNDEISIESQRAILAAQPLLQISDSETFLPSPKVAVAKLKSNASELQIISLINKLKELKEVQYASPFLIYKDGTEQAALDQFIVKLRNSSDYSKMEELVIKSKAVIVKQYEYDKLLYFIKTDKNSAAPALELANMFSETNNFATSEPDLLKFLNKYNTNDPFLNLQWSINNTGSSTQYNGVNAGGIVGADMRVLSAWGISTGSSSIKIAIIDEGVDLVHPDLIANLVPGFDGTGLGSGGAPSGNDAHGTACAGIVAAAGNNSIGIAGISYNSKIVPVRIAYSSGGSWVTTSSGIGTSLDWSWNQGAADILSNSWGGGSPSTLINDPISRAVTLGRGGKGSIVLFAAGNSNGANSYPATLTNVVSVVAMSMCNQRKSPSSCDGETFWGSNFGTGVDVSAPGVKIYTTDISGSAGYSSGNYTATFNGTSSATPNTSGVMALILSVNPSLTYAQARQILESSCDKVGGYTYNSGVSGQPNGSWSTDLGHGRVNAFTALQLANPQPCTTPTVGGTATGPASLASGSTGTFVLAGSNGTNIQWQSSNNSGISYSDIGGANSANSSFTLPSGTYLIRAAVSRINCTISYSNILNLSVTSPIGDVFSNPINITMPYITSISNATGFTNAYTGTNNQSSPDIFFRFTTGPCTDSLRISTCGSPFDTYLHLLNSAGTNIISNDDNGSLCAGTPASLKVLVLPNTVYYVVAEGYSNNTGLITLSINQIDNPIFSTNITPSGPLTFCQGGSVTLTAGLGASYLWSNGATTASTIVSTSGIYSVTVTNTNGCSASSSSTVIVNSNPFVFSTSGGGPYCSVPGTGTSVTLSGSQIGVSYAFKYTAGGIVATLAGTGSALTASNIIGVGTITVLATNNTTGCFSNMNGSASVTQQIANTYFRDFDGDTFGDASNTIQACSVPNGYVTNSTDCNDNNAAVNIPQSYFVDADGDGFGSSTLAMLCSATAPTGYSSNSTDCNDNNAAVNAPQSYFVDADGDGFGSSTIAMLCSATAPTGYSSNSTDCNDNNAAVNAPQSYFVDADGDGFGSTTVAMLCSSTAPAGYSNNSTDCDDANAAINTSQTYFVDADGDGFGSTTTAQLCTTFAPAGYSSNSTDCDDANAVINIGQTYFVDADGDGFGSTTTAQLCALSAPAGYSSNSTDCDDANAAVNSIQTYFVDADEDGFGSTTSALFCTLIAPLGYSSNSTDCDDGNANINSSKSEICNNNIDDDCDGLIDENCNNVIYYQDLDNDSFGNPAVFIIVPAGSPVIGYVLNNNDCNDANAAINPNALEICNGIDDNCDGSIDNNIPSIAIASGISGPIVVCRNTTNQVFSINALPSATSYIWTLPVGASGSSTSNSIIVSFGSTYNGGVICVRGINACLSGSNFCRSVNLNKPPTTPSSIAGIVAGACSSVNRTYSINPVNGATTYIWTAPTNSTIISGQGSTSVILSFASNFVNGNLTVQSSNCAGNSGNRNLNIYNTVIVPSSISGLSNGVCPNSIQTFICSTVLGALNYTWTAPANSNIISGQGTNKVTVSFGSSFTIGNLRVKSSSGCFTSTDRLKQIQSVPTTPLSIVGNITEVCGGTIQNYSCPISTTGALSYNWTVPTGCIINSGLGTNAISVAFPIGFTTGNISVTANNNCGMSSSRTVVVSSGPSQPAIPTGQISNLCGGGTFTYTLPAIAGASSYNWSIPNNSTLVANTGLSVTLNFPSNFTTGILSVVAVNTCGSSVARTVNLTSLPGTPLAITGSASVCPNANNLTFSTIATSGFTYNWLVPTGTVINSGQGSNQINMNWNSVAGTIFVRAQNSCGASQYRLFNVGVNPCKLANETIMENRTLLVYPNPSSGLFNIAKNDVEKGDRLIVFDMLGKIILEKTFDQMSDEIEINLENVDAGIYLFKFSGNNLNTNLKVIKE